ncbi:hypothetical protein DFH07DRAFT_747523, partial [Mycena maculata]
AMLDAFKDDHALFRAASKDWRHNTQVLRSGCAALDINLSGMVIRYANAGDCRALVCGCKKRKIQTRCPRPPPPEQERLKLEHPKEDLLIVSGRLFGKLISTRDDSNFRGFRTSRRFLPGFGDRYYKLPRGINNWQHKKHIDVLSSLDQDRGKVPLNAQYESYFYGYRTPPYIISTPDVGVMNLTPGGFVVCGSDGLFDLVSSNEVAGIVWQGIIDGVENLALTTVMETRKPGDDVTILVLQYS